MGHESRTHWIGGTRGVVTIGFFALLILWFDSHHPQGVAGGVPYVALVLVGLLSHSSRLTILAAILGTGLTVIGYALSPPGADQKVVLLNRALAIFAQWSVAGTTLLYQRSQERLQAALRLASETDPMTGVFNRRRIHSEICRRSLEAETHQVETAVFVIDIDGFKRINDSYGHETGDRVLCSVCNICSQVIRQGDFLGRLGGDELLVIAPKIDSREAEGLGERIRAEVEAADWPPTVEIRPTVSIGIARIRTKEDRDLVIPLADKALYKAKSAGRNRVASSRS